NRPRARKPNSHQLMQLLAKTRALRPFVSWIATLAIVSCFALSAATFTDANWSSMNPSIPGADGTVWTAVVDGTGNIYIGGSFSIADNVVANRVAKWNGSTWSSLGSGMPYPTSLYALAIIGSDVSARGTFT